MKLYSQKDVDQKALRGARIAVMGYGSQGRAHALNLKDSGFDVGVGARKGGPGWKKAKKDGLEVAEPARAARLVTQRAVDSTLPGLDTIIDRLVDATSARHAKSPYESEISRAMQHVLVEFTPDEIAMRAGQAPALRRRQPRAPAGFHAADFFRHDSGLGRGGGVGGGAGCGCRRGGIAGRRCPFRQQRGAGAGGGGVRGDGGAAGDGQQPAAECAAGKTAVFGLGLVHRGLRLQNA